MNNSEILFKISSYLKDNGIKYKFVAERIGMNPVMFSDLMNGKRKLSLDAYIRICGVLKLSLDFFVEK